MGWIETYPKIIAELKAKNGSYDSATPKLRASDMIAVLGMYTASVVPAIERVADNIVRSDFATSDGLFSSPADIKYLATLDTIDARTYVSKTIGIKAAPWKRTPTQLTQTQQNKAQLAGLRAVTYEPVRDKSIVRNEQLELIGFVRQMMADYQRALDASALVVQTYAIGFASRDSCASFLSAIRSTGSDLDVLAENPPTTLAQDVAGATRSAVTKSEAALVDAGRFVGKAAAEVGNVAGEVAGAFAGGFFDKAGLVTIAVAGIAAYVAFH